MGQANENGDIEQRHHRFTKAVAQELLLRDSQDFASLEEYQQSLKSLLKRLNAGRREQSSGSKCGWIPAV